MRSLSPNCNDQTTNLVKMEGIKSKFNTELIGKYGCTLETLMRKKCSFSVFLFFFEEKRRYVANFLIIITAVSIYHGYIAQILINGSMGKRFVSKTFDNDTRNIRIN